MANIAPTSSFSISAYLVRCDGLGSAICGTVEKFMLGVGKFRHFTYHTDIFFSFFLCVYAVIR